MELIDKEELIGYLELEIEQYMNSNHGGIYLAEDAVEEIKYFPTVEAYSKEAVEQIMWERDMAISQLNDYGVQFGEQADCVRVVRCKDCLFFNTECILINDGDVWYEDDFCSYGRRMEKDNA